MPNVMSSPLEKEFQWYRDHQEELLKKYEGKFVVIKSGKVLNAYTDIREAVDETAKIHEMGSFLVQKCTSGDQDYTATFHTRVA